MIIYIAAVTGLRYAEVLATERDIDFGHAEISVNKTRIISITLVLKTKNTASIVPDLSRSQFETFFKSKQSSDIYTAIFAPDGHDRQCGNQ